MQVTLRERAISLRKLHTIRVVRLQSHMTCEERIFLKVQCYVDKLNLTL